MMKYWFVFCKGDLLLQKDKEGQYTVPFQEDCPVSLQPCNTVHNITPFEHNGGKSYPVKTVELDGMITEMDGYEMVELRQAYRLIPLPLYLKAGKCEEILYWDRQTKFCGCCGSPMELATDISKRCSKCGKEIWPALATAIIVLIHKGEQVLLVKARNFKRDYYGLVAGFVETGESLEEAVQREVREETGLEITNIRYFGSQPWPYPCGLMVGFHADYVSGDIHLQEEELKTAGWFTRDNMPTIPEKLSIARCLIDSWL
ncbi:MAG: NAD(+) diphosphatase [Bacteroidales bacterium]|nr:NAD(+) diphosphatase [Bacteroidales bacterium]MCM1147264.1 NAD(+) diphosphatase [Bacteroidales bacterium]MCM1206303.1 NAD(+) diphosphatase [Bacillota bacterium]